MTRPGWQFWIDRGGTFTDVVACSPEGELSARKLLSENPERYADAAMQAIREVFGLAADAPLPPEKIASVKMGTTVGTNALLEHKGEPTALAITAGLGDQLRIGYQARPDIFAREIILPEMLYSEVVEIPERLAADGEILRPLDHQAARAGLEAAHERGCTALAICLMHGYRDGRHEAELAGIAREIGFSQISVSHEVAPLIKLVARGDTTVVDAYLSPLLRRYIDRVAAELGGTRLMFMQSSGGLADAQRFRGKDSILSGPAGGIVGAVKTAASAGLERVVTFDMGGTSTDVAHYHGRLERVRETEIAGNRLQSPMLDIQTVAAGGGSICHFDGSRYRVGPNSAGADPGPACYRRGGPLTVTDCNVMLGKLQPDFFPHVFGPEADQPLDDQAVARRFAELAAEIEAATGTRRRPEEVAEGFLTIAVENMAGAIKQISVQRGHDVTRYGLNCFGGAGGQHACLVADALGIDKVLIHPFAGVLSAYGMGLADSRALREQGIERELTPDLADSLADGLAGLETAARAELEAEGCDPARIEIRRALDIKYRGTDTSLEIPHGALEEIAERFAESHRQLYGFTMPDTPLMVAAAKVEAIERAPDLEAELARRIAPDTAGSRAAPLARVTVWMAGAARQAPIHDRAALPPGTEIPGPAILREDNATTVVEPGWRARITEHNHLMLERSAPRTGMEAMSTAVDPVMLEVFNNLFMNIAEQMGETLRNTAHSVNIKERLDFSCALFDRECGLIANAPHMPVHLGSMGRSVEVIARQRGASMRPGDVFMLNNPYNGGTHLPDITVITPVFDRAGEDLLFYVASRGHHADVGGRTPGSMPPDSTHIDEEGVLIEDFQLVSQGRFEAQALRALLSSGRWPARNPDQNIGDLQAQIAANAKGVAELRTMVDSFGLEVVQAYMGHVQDNAEEQVRRVIDRLDDGRFTLHLDNGHRIEVATAIDREGRGAHIDFTGTSPQSPDNFNAPAAVTRAAVLYVFRTLVDEAIPMNEGCLKPIEITIPDGSMLSPRHPAAVVAGNVEVSQCVTDALYGALGAMAAAQGTMNNFTWGNERHQYYETICGGAGAGPDFDGTSAVHTHMTNSRLTDPEVLEWYFPVRLESFSIRRGSGGAGAHRGGDGTRREVTFLEPMTAAILANRRRVPPFGLAGGDDGAPGRSRVIRADGREELLAATDSREMAPGDRFVIETPGGGGYGAPGES